MTTETLSPGSWLDTVGPHDHAWRRVAGAPVVGVFAEYECDVCQLSWSI